MESNKYTTKGVEDKLDSLDSKLESIDERLSDINNVMIRNTASLEEHMRRSLLNEEAVDLLRTEIKPLSQHVATINNIAKMISVLAALAGIYNFFRR